VLKPRTADGNLDEGVNARKVDFDDFDDLLRGWVPLTVALNSLNRSMGLIDPYPFVLSETVIDKLRFVHDVIELSQADEKTIAKVAANWEKRLLNDVKGKQPEGTAAKEAQASTPNPPDNSAQASTP
jgi:hypothetical protein